MRVCVPAGSLVECVCYTHCVQHVTAWDRLKFHAIANSCLSKARHIPQPPLLLYVCGLTHSSGQNVILSVYGRDCI